MDLDLSEDAFRLKDSWRIALFGTDGVQADHFSAPLDLDFKLANNNNPYAEETTTVEELKLPPLEAFSYGPLEDVAPPEESVGTTEDDKAEGINKEPEHIWDLVAEEKLVGEEINLYSWEAFQEPGREEPCAAYLSEAGPEAFDIALRIRGDEDEFPQGVQVLRGDVFLKSVFALGLGRSSALFQYDARKRDFKQLHSDHTPSGYSQEAMRSYIANVMACGRIVRHLQDFADKTRASGKSLPARVALATCIDKALEALELHLVSASSELRSLLQIQELFERPQRMLREIYDLAKSVRNARSNEELASLVFKRCQYCDQEPEWLRGLMLQIMARVSRPWLELAEQWICLRNDTGASFETQGGNTTFVEQEEYQRKDEDSENPDELKYSFRPEMLPTFMSLEDGENLFNLGRDVRILRAHHSGHPLAQTRLAQDNEMALEWQFDWEGAERIAEKAKSFHNTLARAISEYGSGHKSSQHTANESPGPADEDLGSAFTFAGPTLFDSKPSMHAELPDELYELISTRLTQEPTDADDTAIDLAPPVATTPMLSFGPLLSAQRLLTNAVMVRLFLTSHHLRLHFNLQRSYHLLGDGVFVSRLTAALFDPDQSSTERKRGVMRGGVGMGLRLGNRGTWPPASSELRLALMGILSDCYHALYEKHSKTGTHSHDLPGSLSFAIRQLSEDEAEKIMDADSLHALDFLRLQYSPPSPLGAVLTPASLDRYDTIFKFLLRLIRLLFVVSHLPKNLTSKSALLFRQQAEHFISTCCRYFFDTGLSETWAVFVEYLDGIESRLQAEDKAEELGTRVMEGIEDLRKHHDLCLDRITFALLLRNRQQKVMKVLEEIFGTILEFSKCCNSERAEVFEERVRELHKSFVDSVKLFQEVCRGLAGRRGYGKPGGERRGGFGGQGSSGEENTIERLVVALDYNGFCERRS